MLAKLLTTDQTDSLANAGFKNIEVVEKLCAGTSNQNFRVRARGEEWVLRINNPLTEALCPRANEVACWRQAADAGLAPPLAFVSEDHQLYVSHFVAQAHPWDTSFHVQGTAVTLLDRLLKALAQLPLPKHQVTTADQWAHYQVVIRNRYAKLDASLRDVADDILAEDSWMQASIARLARTQTQRYCHRDLNPTNLLLRDGKLLCIDFEYACASDPRFDLAALLACHKLTSTQTRQLQRLHLTGSPQQQALDFADATYCYWVFTAAWGVVMCSDGKAAVSWLREALGHLHHHKARLPL